MPSPRLTLTLALALVALPAASAAQGLKIKAKISDLEARASADSNDPVAHYNLAIGYWTKRRYDEAEHELREAILLEPRFAQAYLALGVLPLARDEGYWKEAWKRDPDAARAAGAEARSSYRRAFMIDPLVDLAILGAVVPPRTELQKLKYAYDDLYFHYEKGLLAIRQGRFEQAYGHFEELLRHHGPEESPDAFFWFHALAAARIGRYDEATEDADVLFNRSRYEEETDSLVFFVPLETNQYRYLLATFKHRAGETEAAIRLYEEAAQNDLGLYMAHVRLAEIHEERGRRDDAMRERQSAVSSNPEDSSLLLDLGRTLMNARRWAQSEEAFRQGIAVNPRDPRLYYLLGVVLMRLEKNEDARWTLERFIALAPGRYGPWIEDARARLAQGTGPGVDRGPVPDEH